MTPVPGLTFAPLPALESPYDSREAALLMYARDRIQAGRAVVVRRSIDAKGVRSTVHVEKDQGAYAMVWITAGSIEKTCPLTADEARWILRAALRQGINIETEPPIGNGREQDLETRLAGT